MQDTLNIQIEEMLLRARKKGVQLSCFSEWASVEASQTKSFCIFTEASLHSIVDEIITHWRWIQPLIPFPSWEIWVGNEKSSPVITWLGLLTTSPDPYV